MSMTSVLIAAGGVVLGIVTGAALGVCYILYGIGKSVCR